MQDNKRSERQKQQLLFKMLLAILLLAVVNVFAYMWDNKVLHLISIIPTIYIIVSCIQYARIRRNRLVSFGEECTEHKARSVKNNKNSEEKNEQLLHSTICFTSLLIMINVGAYKLNNKMLHLVSIPLMVYIIVNCFQYKRKQRNCSMSFERGNGRRRGRGAKNGKIKENVRKKQEITKNMLIALVIFALLNLLSVILNYKIFDILAIIPIVYMVIGLFQGVIERQ